MEIGRCPLFVKGALTDFKSALSSRSLGCARDRKASLRQLGAFPNFHLLLAFSHVFLWKRVTACFRNEENK